MCLYHGSWLLPEQTVQVKEPGWSYSVFYVLILEATYHHICHILLVKSELLNPSHIEEKGIGSTFWMEKYQLICGFLIFNSQSIGDFLHCHKSTHFLPLPSAWSFTMNGLMYNYINTQITHSRLVHTHIPPSAASWPVLRLKSENTIRTSLMVEWLRPHASTLVGMGFIPGQVA